MVHGSPPAKSRAGAWRQAQHRRRHLRSERSRGRGVGESQETCRQRAARGVRQRRLLACSRAASKVIRGEGGRGRRVPASASSLPGAEARGGEALGEASGVELGGDSRGGESQRGMTVIASAWGGARSTSRTWADGRAVGQALQRAASGRCPMGLCVGMVGCERRRTRYGSGISFL